MGAPTVEFSRQAANVFLHLLTRCNLRCRHCYINPEQHGRKRLPLDRIESWLTVFASRSPGANLVLLGGEPTLHPDLPRVVRCARRLGFASITIDTNGYLFNDILDRVTSAEVNVFSFSLDGATAETNDRIRGKASYEACLNGIRRARAKRFHTSLIYTVSRANLGELPAMGPLLEELGVERFFIQVLGLRGKAAPADGDPDGLEVLQVSPAEWLERVPAAAEAIARRGVRVIYPKVFLNSDEKFECAGLVADNYFVFPNGRVYRCPLCEDYPVHSLEFQGDRLVERPRLNESDFFRLHIAEGCVMDALVQPGHIAGDAGGASEYRIACCLLKEEIPPH
ncbi:MAG: radical SAM protein [Desulfobacterales bacterium]|jgi:MoaA/NifB/PqqE/SkfB family radical SAM enzyme|nr:radical SAM protein [Desulfobacterales bacterium]